MVVRGLTWLLDTTTKMLLANEILDLVLEIMTLLGVVPIIMVEIVIPPFVPYLRKHLHWVGVLESFFLDLEEDFNLGRVKRYRWQPRSWHFSRWFSRSVAGLPGIIVPEGKLLSRAVWGTDCGCIDGCANYGMCGIIAYIILINAYTWWVKPRKASTVITSGPGFGTRGENPISLNNL
ncbi:hypothetical protein BHM03_00038993 [Ensete ventricosum]|nr:hypothetical protein BHM03_00038993 [Ensete ventricosum]